MSIFGRKSVVVAESFSEVQASEDFVEDTLSGLQELLTESAGDAYRLTAGLYISDILMEEAVLYEGASAEVLLEGFVQDTWAKLQKIFTTMWEKVKGWFNAAKRRLTIFFTTGEKFIKTFKSELEGKATAGFSYKGYKYDYKAGAGKVKSLTDKVKSQLNEAVNFSLDAVTVDAQNKELGSHASGDSFNLKEAKEKLITDLGAKDQRTLIADVIKSFRSDETETQEWEEFKGNSREEMIAWLEKGSTHIREVEQRNTETDDAFKRVLASIKAARSKISGAKEKDEKAGQLTALATHKYDLARHGLTVITQLNGAEITAIKEISSNFQRILKSFLTYKDKSKKEDDKKEGVKEGNETSILESALRFV